MNNVEIQAPWGTLKANASCMEAIKHMIAQLNYFLDRKTSPDPDFTRRQLRGYQAVLDSGDERNAEAFLEYKALCHQRGERPPENLAVVAMLKKEGRWL